MHIEFEYLKDNFVKNGYPLELVHKYIKDFLNARLCVLNSVPIFDVPKCKLFIKLPFYGKSSIRLKKQLISLFQNNFL